ncbi:MAG: hypothetical protein ACK5Y2_10000, partial [Bdellovibrionales bacterium]
MASVKALNGLGIWWKKLQSLSETRHDQKTYILPTSFGMAYGTLCFILLLMAMAYGNNLVYGVCFYLTVMGLGLARSINDNVNNCRIESVVAHEIFAGGPQKIQIQVRNMSNEPLRQLELRLSRKEVPVTFHLHPNETKLVEMLWTPSQRGYMQAPPVRLNSPYPSGLFNAWKVKRFKESIIIYP